MERRQKDKKYSCSLTAAALQDHISRQLGGSLEFNKRKSQVKPTTRKAKQASCKKCGKNGSTEQEYTLDPATPPLTLAQTLGLVDAPRQLLTGEEWEGVRACSNKRQDSKQPCPICQEEFGLSKQALLSCSHVFHLACLKSFERFSCSKRCPLCRTEGYQTRVVCDGAKQYRNRAATLIQSAWRGYKVRRWYKRYRDSHPPSHPVLRKRHYEDKLSHLTRQLMMSCDVSAEGVASVLSESERALENARFVMREFDLCTADNDVWSQAREKAKTYLMTDCAVCLTPLLTPSQPHTSSRPLSVLSCGHLLHTSCINSLEHYSDSGVCPLCRSPYFRTTFS